MLVKTTTMADSSINAGDCMGFEGKLSITHASESFLVCKGYVYLSYQMENLYRTKKEMSTVPHLVFYRNLDILPQRWMCHMYV